MKTTIASPKKNINTVDHRPTNVLHIIKSLGRGGAETLLPETLARHNKEKFNFHYIYFLPWKNQMVEQIKKEGGQVSCFKANNNLRIFLQINNIVRYVKQHQIQVIHCHLPWAGIVGRMVGKITGIPVVYTEHNKWERYHKLTYFLNKASFSSQQKVIAVSDDVAQSIKNHYKKINPAVKVVLNGINTQKFIRDYNSDINVKMSLAIPETAIVIGTACVFRVQKRLHIWLDIAKELHTQFPHTHFIIAGDGPLRHEVEARIKELNMGAYTHLVGLQPEIRPYMKAIDIFMMSSEFEGLPIALLEAMSMECMPACTAAGGIPELVNDSINGILVPVDEPMLLVDRIAAYLHDRSAIQEKAKAARHTVCTHFEMHKMVDELETIYTEMINA